MAKFLLAFVLLFSFSFAYTPYKKEYRQGVKLFLKKQYKKAFPHLNKAYKLGSYEAAYLLAQMYCKGLGVKKDLNAAKLLAEYAIANGSLAAHCCLAKYYLLKNNKKEALNEYKEAKDLPECKGLAKKFH